MAGTLTVPQTTAIASHGLAILANNKLIGGITNWAPDQNRGIKAVFELGDVTDPGRFPGEPFDLVPGNISGTNVSIDRYEIYQSRFVEVFGSPDLTMLTMQLFPIEFREAWSTPEGGGSVFGKRYITTWFTKVGTRISAEGDRVVLANASIMYKYARAIR